MAGDKKENTATPLNDSTAEKVTFTLNVDIRFNTSAAVRELDEMIDSLKMVRDKFAEMGQRAQQ